MRTTRTTLTKALLTMTAFILASCGFERQTEYDLNQDQEINYADYVDLFSLGMSVEDESPRFGLVSAQTATPTVCSAISAETVSSSAGYTDSYSGAISSFVSNFDVIIGDHAKIKIHSITCATGSGGADEVYNYTSSTSQENQFPVNTVLTLTHGASSKTLELKYVTTCDAGCGGEGQPTTLQLSLISYSLEAGTESVVSAEFGHDLGFSVPSGLSAPNYSLKALKYASTHGASGALGFSAFWECNAAGSPAVNDDDLANSYGQCNGYDHAATKVVWIDKNQGGGSNWADQNNPTEAEINAAIDVISGTNIVTVQNQDQVAKATAPNDRENDQTGIDTVAVQDGFAPFNVKTGPNFYQILEKYMCIYKEHVDDKGTPEVDDDITSRGIKCKKVIFSAFE